MSLAVLNHQRRRNLPANRELLAPPRVTRHLESAKSGGCERCGLALTAYCDAELAKLTVTHIDGVPLTPCKQVAAAENL